jgi:hypothetical protein
MKNKNALYVVLGISAGVVAYYIFCKNKNNKRLVGVASNNIGEKPVETKTNKVGVGGGGGGIFSPVAPKPVIPIATTTPLVVNVTSTPTTTPTTTPVTTPVTKPLMEVVSKPTLEPISAPLPVLATDVVSKPTLEPTSPTKPATEVISKPISVTELSNSTTPVSRVDATRVDATQIKSSFQGVGSLCFEVGDCLYDL